MKKNFICMYLFLLATLASCQSCSSDYKDVDDIVVEGVETPVLLGDPFIMLHDGTYYAYGTHADEGIEVYTSDDLKTWKYKGMALQKKDVWADRWFWAPEVYEVNGKCITRQTSISVWQQQTHLQDHLPKVRRNR